MRVLIITAAFVAIASAAPSNIITPIGAPFAAVAPALAAIQIPEIIAPTIDDAQAIVGDLQVKAEDTAREFFEKNQEFVEQNVETINENNRQLVDKARELNEELFWNNEDKKWQTFDAIKTAESELSGAASEIGPVVATRTVIQPLAPAPIVPAPIVAPLNAYQYYQPESHTITKQFLSQTHPAPAFVAEPAAKFSPVVPVVKTAEPIIVAEPATIIKEEKPAIITEPVLKAAPLIESSIIEPAKQTIVTQTLSQTHPSPLNFFPAIPAQPIFRYAEPFYAPTAYYHPGYSTFSGQELYQTHGLEYAKFVHPVAPIAFAAPVFKPELIATEQKIVA